MPPKKANRKAATKQAAPPADAEVFNNGEKEAVEETLIDAKILPNGDSIDENDAKVSPKLKAIKRSSGRAKNVASYLETEATPEEKPVVKGRGKKKLIENEVRENENNSSQPETEKEVDDTKLNDAIKTKPKGRGGGKKAEAKTKKALKTDENEEAAGMQDATNSQDEEVNISESNTKTTGGRKRKQEAPAKKEELSEIKQDLFEDNVEEKISKKNSRNSKKSEEVTAAVESQKKKGKVSKKDKIVEESNAETNIVVNEIKADVKEKKPTKRGRAAAAKPVTETEGKAINGDAEEVLPKKRSRKAPSAEKEIVKEKPKRGRGKKSEREEDKIVEMTESKTSDEENKITGDSNLDKTEEIEETSNINKKADTETEAAAAAPKVAAKTKGGRKRAAPSANKKKPKTSSATADDGGEGLLDDGVDNTELEDEADGSKSSKTKKSKPDAAPLNSTVTKYNKEDFELPPPSDGQIIEEPRFNLKISSWNVAGLRSWIKKDGLKFLEYEQPDIFCLQETKCTNDQLPEEVVPIPGYHPYWLCMPGGYAGVAIYSKIMPINVEYGIGNKEFDDCGRIITAEYEKFFLINVYVPNSGRKLVNLEARMKWEKLFQQFIQDLDARKPVVICGDMNVSHQEIDLANPKTNTRSAGFTKEERDKMTELLSLGYIDTFRHLYPERKGAYTYWTYMANARSRNVGWRLDYFIVSERFIKRVVDNCIRSQCMGSDHCPITLFLKL